MFGEIFPFLIALTAAGFGLGHHIGKARAMSKFTKEVTDKAVNKVKQEFEEKYYNRFIEEYDKKVKEEAVKLYLKAMEKEKKE